MRRSRRAEVLVTALAVAALASATGCSEDGPVQLPEPLAGPPPVEYPLELWDMGLEGETNVMVRVNRDGGVDSAFVAQSSGFEDFDSAAVSGARKMRFTPGRRGTDRVAVWIKVPIRFSRDARQGGAGAPQGY